MGTERFRPYVAVFVLFIKDEKILLLRRYQTGWQDGNYSLPAGHVEENEKVSEALIREIKEETSIELSQEQIKLAHVMHRKSLDRVYVDFFFVADQWDGEPKNLELNKCDDLSWFPLDELPSNVLKFVRRAIDAYRSGAPFSEFGWSEGEAE